MLEAIYQITAPHFCAAIVVINSEVVQSAPILKWAIGKDMIKVRRYCERKGWTIEQCPPFSKQSEASE